MSEVTVPAAAEVPADGNLSDFVWHNAEKYPTDVLLSRQLDGRWHDVTAVQFQEEVAAVAKGLIAAGVRPGDRVGLMSHTRYEWTLIDFAIWAAGAVTVPVYETSSAEQVEWVLGNSEAVAVVVEDAGLQKTVESVRGNLPALKHLWQIEDGAVDTIGELGAAVTDGDLDTRRRTAGADDLATIVYTSGTTGRPKGCQLTHRNLYSNTLANAAVLSHVFSPGQSTLLFLPLAHVFGRIIQCGSIYSRVRLGHLSNVSDLPAAFAEFSPDFVLAVPRVFEKIYTAAQHRAHSEGKGAIFDRAERAAIAYSEGQDTGRIPVTLKAEHALFDRLVYTKLRAALGGSCRAVLSGSAPLGNRLGHFFRGIGVPVYEGYGLTETSPVATVNTLGQTRIGTVGRPIPGTTIRIGDDGEILIKGEQVFHGYWKNPEATAEAIDADGWFHSGDLGELDADGFLSITGRKKELIVTAGGKNVAPAVLEDRVRAHALVSQCMVVGDQKPYVAALVTIDPDAFGPWKEKAGKPADATVADLAEDPDLVAEIQHAIDDANKAVSRAESIRRFRILAADFTEESGELTPTLKLRRAVVGSARSEDISALYT
ncbi:AMP-dependent synthetase/ligase [Fodinicola acaciae]|uniref:AMP-dependent synthetase/ligase n=1 Tax=Fodinicola acaciae TaxID=2681555 RepID=UPI0013D15E8D|nr:AMP-dependent synthetase/ligase [Fodinicola acaciae]